VPPIPGKIPTVQSPPFLFATVRTTATVFAGPGITHSMHLALAPQANEKLRKASTYFAQAQSTAD
jgi:hypothetical protein